MNEITPIESGLVASDSNIEQMKRLIQQSQSLLETLKNHVNTRKEVTDSVQQTSIESIDCEIQTFKTSYRHQEQQTNQTETSNPNDDRSLEKVIINQQQRIAKLMKTATDAKAELVKIDGITILLLLILQNY